MIFKKILLFGTTILSFNVFAQEQKIVYPHNVFWHKTEINEIFENKIGVGVDYVYRSKNEMGTGGIFDSHARTSIRPWIHYQFSKNARLSISPLGYMHTNEYVGKIEDYDRLPFHELRTTFQFFHHYKHNNPKWMHTWRYRYELRWQEVPGTDDYRDFSRFRFRYRLRYVINRDDFYENNMFYAAVSNEIGLNIGKNVTYNTFNQNRLYVGFGYRFFDAARVELRYVNRFRTRGATGIEFDNDQGIMLGIYIDQLSGFWKKKDEKIRYTD